MDGRITFREGGQIYLAAGPSRSRGDISRTATSTRVNIVAEANIAPAATQWTAGTPEKPTIDLASEDGR
jgi:hypothetical protein